MAVNHRSFFERPDRFGKQFGCNWMVNGSIYCGRHGRCVANRFGYLVPAIIKNLT